MAAEGAKKGFEHRIGVMYYAGVEVRNQNPIEELLNE